MAGNSLDPDPNENLQVHLSEHRKERVRYQGLEEQYPSVQLLDEHISKTQLLVDQKYASSQQQGGQPEAGGADPSAPAELPGQMAGDIMAGAAGG